MLRCETLLSSALQAIVPRSRRVTAGRPRLRMQCSKNVGDVRRRKHHPGPLPLARCSHLYMVGGAHLLPDERVPGH